MALNGHIKIVEPEEAKEDTDATTAKKGNPGWRNDPSLFREAQSSEYNINTGILNFSPAWFMSGHENEVNMTKPTYYFGILKSR